MNESVTIDPEFQNLIPPLSNEEFQQLKNNCLRDGIQDSLKVWNGILIDGHNRYKISEDCDLNYEIEEMDFPNREAVKQWIIMNQLGRRNVNTYTRSCLVLELKESIRERAKEKEAERKTTYQKSEKSNLPKIDTTKELARLANTSHDTINKVEYLESHADEKTKERLKSGEQSINSAYLDAKQKEKKKLDVSAKTALGEAEERHEQFQNSNTVSMGAVMQERKDAAKIAEGRKGELWNIIKKILFIEASGVDFSIINSKNLSESDVTSTKSDLTRSITILTKILNSIGR